MTHKLLRHEQIGVVKRIPAILAWASAILYRADVQAGLCLSCQGYRKVDSFFVSFENKQTYKDLMRSRSTLVLTAIISIVCLLVYSKKVELDRM